jgi:hypothetical protein
LAQVRFPSDGKAKIASERGRRPPGTPAQKEVVFYAAAVPLEGSLSDPSQTGGMTMRKFLPVVSLIAAVAAALVLVASAGAGAATTSLAIAPQASLGTVPGTVVVTVVFQCPAGESNGAFGVFVSQPQPVGPNVEGQTIVFPVTCDGTKQTTDVTVTPATGLFTAGRAHAQAEGVAGDFNAVFTSKEITIS